jgi:hypothetical protein
MVPQQGYVSVSRRPPDIEDYIDILRRYLSSQLTDTMNMLQEIRPEVRANK